MNTFCKAVLLFALGWLLVAGQAVWGQTTDDFIFTTLPPDIAGAPGETIGWGYTFTNLSTTDWLWAVSVVSSNTFTDGTATLNPFDYPVIAPGATLSTPYDGTNGLVDLTWDLTATPGLIDSGVFTVTGYFYDNDPFNGGIQVGDGEDQSSAYSATVIGPSTVPEPGSFGSLLTGLLVFGAAFLYRRRKADGSRELHVSVTVTELVRTQTCDQTLGKASGYFGQ